MKKREIMFNVGVYGIYFLVILIGWKIITGLDAEENYWLVYPLALVLSWPSYLLASKKANLLSRNDVKKNVNYELKMSAIFYFITVCVGLLLGYFPEIIQFNNIIIFFVLLLIMILNSVLGEYFAYLFWKPKSMIALDDCMTLYLKEEDGSKTKEKLRKLLLKNFNTNENKYYDNPQTWLMIINNAVLSFEESEQKITEIIDLFSKVELSETVMKELAELMNRIIRSKELNWDMKIYPGPLILEKAISILRNKVEYYFARQ